MSSDDPAADAGRPQCPVCRAGLLRPHCVRVHNGVPRIGCSWRQCSNLLCDALLDPAAGRGHALDTNPKAKRGARRKVTLGAQP